MNDMYPNHMHALSILYMVTNADVEPHRAPSMTLDSVMFMFVFFHHCHTVEMW